MQTDVVSSEFQDFQDLTIKEFIIRNAEVEEEHKKQNHTERLQESISKLLEKRKREHYRTIYGRCKLGYKWKSN